VRKRVSSPVVERVVVAGAAVQQAAEGSVSPGGGISAASAAFAVVGPAALC
jgi:hypothetical protein